MKSFLKRLRNISLVFVLLIWQVVFAGAPLIQSNLAHAATDPSHVNQTVQGCRNGGTITLPNGDGKFICPDSAYTGGDLGKGWNELDLVPFRLTTSAGNSAPSTQTYDTGVAFDAEDAGHPGYDVISQLTLNAAESSPSCVLNSQSAQTDITPGFGGIDKSIGRTVNITQAKNSTCVFDYYGRLALGSHLFPGSSLHGNLSDGTLSTTNQDVPIPVKEIIPQSIAKNMAATRDSTNAWTVSKLSTPASLNFGDVCSPNFVNTKDVSVKVTWTKVGPTPSGDVTIATHVYATNPASRIITTSVTDKVYEGSTQANQIETDSATMDIPANTTKLILTDVFTVPSSANEFNDVATATYTDKVTGIPVPGQTSTTATASVADGIVTDSSATVTDSESITGSGLSFKAATPSVGSYTDYIAGNYTTGPVDWSSGTQTSSSSVTFSKTVKLDPNQVTSGTLSDTASLTGSNGFTTSASANIGISSSATVKLTINKSIPDVLEGSESQTFNFHVYDSGNHDVADRSITFTSGQTTSKSVDVTGLDPGSYKVTEDTATGWDTQSDQPVSIGVPACSGSVSFVNTFTKATAKGVKVTTPTGSEQGWSFTLHNPDGSTIVKTTDSNGDIDFGSLDQEGSYSITETGQTGWKQSNTNGCSFNVDYPADAGKTFTCTITNTELGNLSGYKFNDINGNHVWDNGEPTLSGWKIDLYSCVNQQIGLNLNFTPVQDCSALIGQKTTGQDGSYSFTNLDSGNYKVCEEMQSNWTRTYPQTSDGCTYFTINLTEHPGQSVTAYFGNQAHGTLTIIKNVDTNGDGTVDQFDSNDWSWNYNGDNGSQSDITTGSTNSQDVAAGEYTVSENQKTDYHFTDLTCENDNGSVSVSPDTSGTFSVDLAGGENLVCTYTNTHDTGTITVVKNLYPNDDPGKFNLQINGQDKATNVGDGGTTGKVTVVTGDGYYVSETAGTGTDLKNYQSSYWCTNEQTSGNGTQSSEFSVIKDQNITCYFDNVRLGTLQGEKFNDLNGDGQKDSSEPGLEGWTIQLYDCQQDVLSFRTNSIDQNNGCSNTLLGTTTTDANGNYSFSDLPSGNYKVCEVQQNGWTQTYPDNSGCQEFTIDLTGESEAEGSGPGQIVTLDFGNFQNGTINGFKFSDANGNGKYEPSTGDVKLSGWTITLSKSDGNGGWTQISTSQTDSSGSYSFANLPPADYQVCEVPQTGWIRIFPTGSNCQTETINQSGQNITALFANQKQTTPKVLGATTVLANTGQSAWEGVVAGLLMLSLVLSVNLTAYILAKKQR